MEKIIMATNNPGKIRELKNMLKGYEVISQKEAGIDIDPEENGMTFEENAIIKAKALSELVNDVYIVAEDSGICVEALNGYPGTKTKRAASEELGKNVTDEERNNFLIEKLKDIENKKVVWQTTIALIDKEKNIVTFTGTVEGVVANEMVGDNGFGFDPIFYIEEEKKTLAQMSQEEKDRYSARKRATEKLLTFFEQKNK